MNTAIETALRFLIMDGYSRASREEFDAVA